MSTERIADPDGEMNRTDAPDPAAESMKSERQSFAGSAEGVGSVGFDEQGAYDVTAASRRDRDVVDPMPDDDAEDVGEGAPAPNVTPPEESPQ